MQTLGPSRSQQCENIIVPCFLKGPAYLFRCLVLRPSQAISMNSCMIDHALHGEACCSCPRDLILLMVHYCCMHVLQYCACIQPHTDVLSHTSCMLSKRYPHNNACSDCINTDRSSPCISLWGLRTIATAGSAKSRRNKTLTTNVYLYLGSMPQTSPPWCPSAWWGQSPACPACINQSINQSFKKSTLF